MGFRGRKTYLLLEENRAMNYPYNYPQLYSTGQQYGNPAVLPNTAPQPQQNENGIIWVQGEAAAKAYLVAPGKSILLMDSESNKFYIKSADASGMPIPLRIFTYSEETAVNTPQIDTSQFVTRKELEELLSKFNQKEEVKDNG